MPRAYGKPFYALVLNSWYVGLHTINTDVGIVVGIWKYRDIALALVLLTRPRLLYRSDRVLWPDMSQSKNKTSKTCYRKHDRAMRPIHGHRHTSTKMDAWYDTDNKIPTIPNCRHFRPQLINLHDNYFDRYFSVVVTVVEWWRTHLTYTLNSVHTA